MFINKILILTIITMQIISTNIFAEELVFGRTKSGIIPKISSLVLEEAYKSIGIDIILKDYPAKRSTIEANYGRIDGEVSKIVGIEKQFTNLVMIPIPVQEIEFFVFSKKIKFKIDGWESLRPYKIVSVLGVKFIEKNTKEMDRTGVATFPQIFKLIDADRYDIAVAPLVDGLVHLKNLNITTVKSLGKVDQVKLYHYLNIKHKSLIPKITAALKKMEISGRIKQIREEYISKLQIK